MGKKNPFLSHWIAITYNNELLCPTFLISTIRHKCPKPLSIYQRTTWRQLLHYYIDDGIYSVNHSKHDQISDISY